MLLLNRKGILVSLILLCIAFIEIISSILIIVQYSSGYRINGTITSMSNGKVASLSYSYSYKGVVYSHTDYLMLILNDYSLGQDVAIAIKENNPKMAIMTDIAIQVVVEKLVIAFILLLIGIYSLTRIIHK